MDNDWNKIWERDKDDVLTVGPSIISRIRHVLKLVKRYSHGGNVLDIGCGGGTLLNEFFKKKNFSEYWGVDISEVPLITARRKYPWGKFEVLDIGHQKLNKKFDFITCLMVIDIIEDDHRALDNIQAMLNEGGYLIVTVQHMMKYWDRLNALRCWRRYEMDELKEKCTQHNLRCVEMFSWGWPLYYWYYKLIIKKDEKFHGGEKDKSRGKALLVKLVSSLLYITFFLDDVFIPFNRGRQLIGVFQKQPHIS